MAYKNANAHTHTPTQYTTGLDWIKCREEEKTPMHIYTLTHSNVWICDRIDVRSKKRANERANERDGKSKNGHTQHT